MAMFLVQILIATLSLQLIGHDSAKFVALAKVVLIDDRDIELIAEMVCADSIKTRLNLQIAHITTVGKLKHFFENIDESHKLHGCYLRIRHSLELLEDVLNKSNENVCSDEKLDLIEKYHNLYVTKRQDQQHLTLLSIFFEHYAMEVAAKCQTSLINNLEFDLTEIFGPEVHAELLEFDEDSKKAATGLFRGLFGEVVSVSVKLLAMKNYDDVLMVWDVIHDLGLEQLGECTFIQSSEDELDPLTGEPIKMSLLAKSATNLEHIKAHCSTKLKPIYSKLILPLIRLANLGYSNKGERFQVELEELRKNALVRRWYAATQLCEIVLPVKIYEDPSMNEHDIIVLTTDEAKELKLKQQQQQQQQEQQQQQPQQLGQAGGDSFPSKVKLVYEPQTNSMVGVDKIEQVETIEAQKLVSDIDLNLSSQDRAIRRNVVLTLRRLGDQITNSKLGRFFFPQEATVSEPVEGTGDDYISGHVKRRGTKQIVRQEIGPQLVQSLENISEDEIMQMNAAASRSDYKDRKKKKPRDAIVHREHRRPRPGDINARIQSRIEIMEKPRTMLFGEIMSPIWRVLKALEPSRATILFYGCIFMLLLAIVAIGSGAALAYMTFFG